jgi:hypothetical protein
MDDVFVFEELHTSRYIYMPFRTNVNGLELFKYDIHDTGIR